MSRTSIGLSKQRTVKFSIIGRALVASPNGIGERKILILSSFQVLLRYFMTPASWTLLQQLLISRDTVKVLFYSFFSVNFLIWYCLKRNLHVEGQQSKCLLILTKKSLRNSLISNISIAEGNLDVLKPNSHNVCVIFCAKWVTGKRPLTAAVVSIVPILTLATFSVYILAFAI